MNPAESNDALKELLLEEYRSLSESFWKSEETGETRVNWFIGIVTAVVGGLVWLSGADSGFSDGPLRVVALSGFAALFAFGSVTLLRILKRNESTDSFKRGCREIRQLFKDHFDEDMILLRYDPFRPIKEGGRRKAGGLAHMVAAINSLIVAGAAGVLVYPGPGSGTSVDGRLAWTYAAIAVGLGVSLMVHSELIKRREEESKRLQKLDSVTHSGGVTYRTQDGRVEYLLVGGKIEKPDEWLLPKGHIEKDEEPRETAVREIREEAGVLARPICLAGRDRFDANREHVIVTYYLMECFGEVAREDNRRHTWCDFPTALRLLSHVQNKHILNRAEIQRHARSNPSPS